MGTSLRAAADRAEELAGTRFGGFYGGIAINQSRSEVIVYRKPGSALDAALRAALPDVHLIFKDSPHSNQGMHQLQQRIDADSNDWCRHGVDIQSLSFGPDATTVEIGVRNVTAEARARLAARYGPDWVSGVEAPNVIPLPMPLPTGR